MNAKFILAHQDQLAIGLLQAELRELNHFVRIARTGHDALEQARNWLPDVLILGLNLPVLNGLEVAKAIRALPIKQPPILFIVNNTAEASQVTNAGIPLVETMIGALDLLKIRMRIGRLLDLPSLEATPDATTAVTPPEGVAAANDFHDPQTGLYNRDFLTDRIHNEAARAARYKTRVTCIVFGVDDYHHLVEQFGTHNAQTAMVGVANVLRTSVRNVDVIGRLREDAFLMIAPQTDEAGARRFVERILQRVRQYRFDVPQPALPIRISVGIAAAATTAYDENIGLVKRAEAALSKARTESHNRISVA